MKGIEERLAAIEKQLGIKQEQDYVWIAYLTSTGCESDGHKIYKVPTSSFGLPEVDKEGDYRILSSKYPGLWVNQRFVNKDLNALKEELKKMIDEAEVIE